MPFLRSHAVAPATHTTTTTRARKPSLLSRLTGALSSRSTTTRPSRGAVPAAPARAVHTAPASRRRRRRRQPAGIVVQRRKPTLGDKISGALLKLRGTATARPGKKAAGTRRMRGTDGRLY